MNDSPPLKKERTDWFAFGVTGLLAVVSVGLFAALPTHKEAVTTFAIVFVSIVIEAMPFVLLGAIVGGVIEVFVPRERVTAVLPKNRTMQVMLAGLMGVVFPVCECAVVPIARRLVNKGVPFSAAMAYLLAGPIVNPLVAMSTSVAYGMDKWQVVAVRMACGYGVAVTVAFLMGRMFKGDAAFAPSFKSEMAGNVGHEGHAHEPHDEGCGHDHGCDASAGPGAKISLLARLRTVLIHAVDDFIFVGQYLVAGAFIAGLATTFLSRSGFVHLSESPAAGVASMMGLAVVLNLCSEADAFVAASFRGAIPFWSQMAFMVLGPMLDFKLMGMYLTFLKRKALIALVVLLVAVVFTAMVTLSHVLPFSTTGILEIPAPGVTP